jgi:spermidine synthase
MTWRIIGFFLAVGVILGRLFLRWKKDKPAASLIPAPENWNWWQLALASFLTLFAELALIRWLGTEVRIFAYVKNLALLVAFLGFGLGCALSRYPVRWSAAITSLLGLVMVVRYPWHAGGALEMLSQAMGAAQDIAIWATDTTRNWPQFLRASVLTGILLLLIAYIFVPLGQIVGRQLELAARPLQGYSWNLAFSLAGILGFFAACWLSAPPTLWVTIVFFGFALLQPKPRSRLFVACLAIPAVLLLHDVTTPLRFTLWTPYQEIEVVRQNFEDGEFKKAFVQVNHTGYQIIVNLSPEFLGRHPDLLKEQPEQNPYNLPFAFSAPNPSVLIVGSGAGNDVAAAVRHQSRSIDAVEIDPGILALGKAHPEHPYSAPMVKVHLTDARAFMRRAHGPYDLVLFGLLDSHTQLSDYSNMRIDNFVYTQESFEEAKSLLAPDGVLFIKFQVNRPWLGKRLLEILTDVFGKAPVVFTQNSSYTVGASCFAISPSQQVEQKLAANASLRELVATHPSYFLNAPPSPLTTDDWPYLYQEGRWIPGIFLSVGSLVLLLGAVLYWQIPEARTRVPSLFFFSMGAGFLLLEAQVISRLALYFGTTWQVNGFVIAAILTALLLANFVIEKQAKPLPGGWYLAGLLASLAAAYLVPFASIAGSAAFVGTLAACILAIPVFFAGLLFATEFRTVESPSAALGANMLGAVVGGLLENCSLIIGLRALLLLAFGLYVLAGVGLISSRKRMPGKEIPAAVPLAGR